MKNISKGQKISIEKEIGSRTFKTAVKWDQSQVAGYEIDASILMLSGRGKLEEEKDFIFYNNPASPDGGLIMDAIPVSGYQKSALVAVDKISPEISRLMFILTIDNGEALNQRFENIKNITVDIMDEQGRNVLLRYVIEGLTKETAVIAVEIYKHNNEWKIQATGNGFNSGLAAILKEYGSEKVQVQEETTAAAAPPEPKLEKIPAGSIDFVKKHQVRIDLAKKQVSSLGLAGQKAQVIIVMDISFSMQPLFKKGTVQDTFDRVMPVAMQFDDDSSVDVWLFHNDSFNHDVPFTLENRENFVNLEIMAKYNWGATNYAPVMKGIADKYLKAGKGEPPAFVLFFTDGDCYDKKQAVEAMKKASSQGIFWKFIGMGGKKNSFEFLEKLDDMPGRVVDNADFFHVNDLEKISDEQLYQNLLEEFPAWLKEAKDKVIIK